MTKICVLCGGVGAARFLRGLMRIVDPDEITAVVNTADDMRLHGLAISPDLDTCTYTVAEVINPETGWGLIGETWQAKETLDLYGGQTWFGLGDRDLGTHLYRTQRLDEGATLAQVTDEIIKAWGIEIRIVPMSNDPVRTEVTIAGGETIDFQRYFVERQHSDVVSHVNFAGIDKSTPAPGVLDAIAAADCVVIAPSNPFVSIDPILSVPGIRQAVLERRTRNVAISPIVGGGAIKGPAADLMRSFGHQVSAAGVAAIYEPLAAHLVIDSVDQGLANAVRQAGMTPHVTNTMMTSIEITSALAEFTLSAIDPELHRSH
ncbi:MAG: 2-phospho-L-lactate transferase [Acidimicrobiales bacterium]|jgi:LPPG:FO 2-phospho-L-lactate transferase